MAGKGEEGQDSLNESGEGEQEGADPLEGKEGEGQDPLEEGKQDDQEGGEEEQDDELLGQASGKRGKAAEPAGGGQADLAAAIRDLRGALTSRPNQTPEQVEAAWQQAEQRSGKTRDQLIDEDRRMREVALMATLEPNKEVGRNRVKEITDGDAELLAEVEKAMATLPPAIQASPNAWADAAYMALGKAKKMGKTVTKSDDNKSGQQRRVIGGTGSAGQSRSGGAGGKGKETPKEYPAFEQHIINRQFAGDAAAYEKYKGSATLTDESKIKAGSSTNAADKELERLTADNT